MTLSRTKGRSKWADLRARLTEAVAALDASTRMTADEAAHILNERARLLAAPVVSEPDHVSEFLIFDLGEATCALESRFVVTVSRPHALAAIPGATDIFVGVTNLRGALLPVVDLKALLGLPRSLQSSKTARLVVLGRDGPDVGVIADSMDGLALLQSDDLAEPPLNANRDETSYIRGVTRDRIILIDAARLLDEPNLRIRPPSPASS